MVRVLEFDPELALGLTRREVGWATQLLLAEMVTTDVEPLDLMDGSAWPESVGLLLLEGVLACRVDVAGAIFVELLGPGDVLCPWRAEPFGEVSEHFALQSCVLAVLDHTLFSQAARWPSILEHLVVRSCQRSQRLRVLVAQTRVVGTGQRVLHLLCHLADRWGRVRHDGIHLDLRLTNDDIGHMVGARGTSVSAGVAELVRDKKLQRLKDGTWLIARDAFSRQPHEVTHADSDG